MPKLSVKKPPRGLFDPIALAQWKHVVREMTAMGTAARVDNALLEKYCVTYSRWRHAEAEVAKQGAVVKSPNGYPIQNPYLAIANTASKQLDQMGDRLGLSPASRSRIQVEQPRTADAFDKFLAARDSKWTGLLA